MKQFVATIALVLASFTTAGAQTFLNHLEQHKAGQGEVTVSQSAEIDELVNGNKQTPGKTATPAATTATPTATAATATATNTSTATATTATTTTTPPTTTTAAAAPSHSPVATTAENENENDIASVDMRKKVMRNSYKVNGYRVQAFAGGNTRNDKQKAEQAGRDIKMRYPELPVYVHFYSPQWKCRVGNFRSLEEANRVLKNVRAMGYKQACVVKGKITVQY